MGMKSAGRYRAGLATAGDWIAHRYEAASNALRAGAAVYGGVNLLLAKPVADALWKAGDIYAPGIIGSNALADPAMVFAAGELADAVSSHRKDSARGENHWLKTADRALAVAAPAVASYFLRDGTYDPALDLAVPIATYVLAKTAVAKVGDWCVRARKNDLYAMIEQEKGDSVVQAYLASQSGDALRRNALGGLSARELEDMLMDGQSKPQW